MLLLSLIFVPETFAPTLLRRKAARLQKEADAANTGEVFIAKYDRVTKTTWEIIKVGMSRPFEMMFKEVIVACLGVYGEYRSIWRVPCADLLCSRHHLWDVRGAQSCVMFSSTDVN